MGAIWELHLPRFICYLLINLLFRIENKWRGQNFLYFIFYTFRRDSEKSCFKPASQEEVRAL